MRAILAAMFVTLATLVSAQDDDPFGISLYGSFLHTANVPNALFFFNDIEEYDGFELRRAMRNHAIDTVVLASNGGNVFEGLNMAGIIHDNELTTYIPQLPDEMGCYSACAYMFFGGKIRLAEGILAVHQTGAYDVELDKSKQQLGQTQQATQFTVSEIIGFLNEFQTPPFVYEKMFRSRDFYEFDKIEKNQLSVGAGAIADNHLNEINEFIEDFFRYLDSLENRQLKKDEADLKQKQETITTQTPQDVTLRPVNPSKPDDVKKITPNTSEPTPKKDTRQQLSILQIQRLLNKAGCEAGTEDGIWGRKTEQAVLRYSRAAGLDVDLTDLVSAVFIEKLLNANFKCQPSSAPKVTSKSGSNSCIAKSPHAKYCNDGTNEISAFPKRSDLEINCNNKKGIYQLILGKDGYGGAFFDLTLKAGVNVIKRKLDGVILMNGDYVKLRMTVFLGNANREKYNIKLKRTNGGFSGTTALGCVVKVKN